MTDWLERLLTWAAKRLPESQGVWIDDLRQEAAHIPVGFKRQSFLWSGMLAAMGEVLRLSVGPRGVGQILLALAGGCVTMVGLVAAVRIEDPFVKMAFYGLLVMYGTAALLAALNLKLLKRFSVGCGFCLLIAWIILGFPMLSFAELPMDYLRALSIEASGVMFGLCIAASYLAWIESPAYE